MKTSMRFLFLAPLTFFTFTFLPKAFAGESSFLECSTKFEGRLDVRMVFFNSHSDLYHRLGQPPCRFERKTSAPLAKRKNPKGPLSLDFTYSSLNCKINANTSLPYVGLHLNTHDSRLTEKARPKATVKIGNTIPTNCKIKTLNVNSF